MNGLDTLVGLLRAVGFLVSTAAVWGPLLAAGAAVAGWWRLRSTGRHRARDGRLLGHVRIAVRTARTTTRRRVRTLADTAPDTPRAGVLTCADTYPDVSADTGPDVSGPDGGGKS